MLSDREHPTPNFWFGYASFMAGLTWLAWPQEGDYFARGLLAGFLGFAAAGGGMRGLNSLRIAYRRRAVRAKSAAPSSTLGDAKFACMSDRRAAGVHNLAAPILAGMADGLPAVVPAGSHLAVEAAPGAGKTTGLVAGAIYHAAKNGYSVVVADPKPELAYLWAETLRAEGFRVVFNNPSFHPDFEHTDTNPLLPIIEAVQSPDGQRDAFTIAEAIALSLIPDVKNDKNKFFTQNDRNALIAIVLCLAAFEPEACYPAPVYRALLDPRRFRDLLFMARESDALEGDLAAIAANLLQKEIDNPEHLESARSGASHALSSFKPSSTLGACGAAHTFDPADMRNPDEPPVILFDIMPADRIEVFGKANALMQTARLQTLRRHREGRPVLFLCDEATNLPIPGIVKDMELLRSFKITIALFYQSFGSLKRVYGDDQANAILSSCVEIYFSVSNLQRAEDISKRVGDRTVKTNSFSFDERGKPTNSVGEQARKLLSPDEVLSLSKDEGLMLVPGIRPVRLRKTPWFEIDPFKHLAGANPHEPHASSPRTVMTLAYGPDSGPPAVPDGRQRLAAARKNERMRRAAPRARFFRIRDFLWLPVVGAAALSIVLIGTPHVLFEYTTRPDGTGQYRCTYGGASGLRQRSQPSPCNTIAFIRFR